MNAHLGIKILLIEDNHNDAELAKVRLANLGNALSYEIFHVELLSEALAFLCKSSVDIILLDLSLPDALGNESIQALHNQAPQIPIIILSGSKETALPFQIVEGGIQDYIEKNRADGELLAHAIRYAIERKKSEKALLASKAEIEQLLASISYVLIGVDEQDRVIQWNLTAEKVFGRGASEILGSPFCRCGIQWAWDRVVQGILECRENGVPVHVNELSYADGSGKNGFFDVTLTSIHGVAEKSRGFLLVANDVSERRQLESQLALAKKMESIGQLAAGIAHEINTPIQFVSNNLEFLKESFVSILEVLEVYGQLMQALPDVPIAPHLLQTVKTTVAEADLEYTTQEIPKALQQSIDGAARVAKIVHAMKDFSHPGTTEKKPFNLNQAIESTITVARNEWKYVADLVIDLDPTLPLVPCLPGEFNQVILNLLINAAHAIEDVVGKKDGTKGTITIDTREKGEWVEVRITDTGTGIPEAVRGKIFDPFFTTKEVGKGTGQGLAIAHDVIINKHGGILTFETEAGQGTTFVIRLPLSQNAISCEDLNALSTSG
ncbi:MAG: ATP-binding protein [Nitrospirales bacterium]